MQNARRVENAVQASAFAQQTNWQPSGAEYNPPAPGSGSERPAQKVSGQPLPGRGKDLHGDPAAGTARAGVWSVYLPGDQHGHYYTFTVEVDGTALLRRVTPTPDGGRQRPPARRSF